MSDVADSPENYEQLQAENSALRDENARLWQQIKLLKQAVFGRKSEKLTNLDIRQELLFGGSEPAETEEAETSEVKAHSRHKKGRKPLPKNLLRERKEYYPEQKSCECCGAELKKIGEEITEELDYVPARFIVREHAKIKVSCPKCKTGVLTGKLPVEVQPIERGRAGAGLLAHIIVSKFCDHLPLHRQEQIFAREGVDVARQRMCDWQQEVAEQIRPIADAVLRHLIAQNYLQADETRIQVQLDSLSGKLHTGYFWAVHAPPNIVYYHYAASRASEVPKELLADFKGVLQTDLYAGYNVVYVPDKCHRLACLAHIRRKLLEADAAKDKEGSLLLKIIASLYNIERDGKKLEPEPRQVLRQQKAAPLLERLFSVAQAVHDRCVPQSPLREATEYLLKQRADVLRYLEDGRYEIDNNAIERQMRPIAIGRKNYLFAGSHAGAERAAIFYTLLNTCKLNKINPYDYLCDVLRRMNDPKTKIQDLMPFSWKPDTPAQD